jgi:hypothetical protein
MTKNEKYIQSGNDPNYLGVNPCDLEVKQKQKYAIV